MQALDACPLVPRSVCRWIKGKMGKVGLACEKEHPQSSQQDFSCTVQDIRSLCPIDLSIYLFGKMISIKETSA